MTALYGAFTARRTSMEEDFTENDEYALLSRRRKTSFGCLIAAVFCICFCLFMLTAGYGYTANARAKTLYSKAKSVYLAAAAYQDELQQANEAHQFTTVIVNQSDRRAENMLHQGIYRYYTDIEEINYAIICDDAGIVKGALVSQRALTPSDLVNLQSFEEQRELMKSLFHHKDAVSSYNLGIKPPGY